VVLIVFGGINDIVNVNNMKVMTGSGNSNDVSKTILSEVVAYCVWRY